MDLRVVAGSTWRDPMDTPYDRIYRFSKHFKDYFLDVKIDMV